jgi:hypothetical protein
VQTIAGHSSLRVPMGRYDNLFESEDHKRAIDAIVADMFR